MIFEYGQDGTYPAFLLEPPTKVALIPLPKGDETVTLTFRYLSPKQRNQMVCHPVLMGRPDAVLRRLFSDMGLSLMLAGTFMVLGVFLWLAAFAVMRFEKTGIALFWLELFFCCVGSWVLGECNLTGLFVDNPGLLYAVAFCGLFVMVIPLTKFCLVILGTRHKRILNGAGVVLELAVCLAVVLQLTGCAALPKTMYLFHVLDPLALVLCGFCIWREGTRYFLFWRWPITMCFSGTCRNLFSSRWEF